MRRRRAEFLNLQPGDGGDFIPATGRSGERTPPNGLKKARQRRARRFRPLIGEWLEPRTLLTGTASIAGMVWNDLDGDGSRGANEPILSGVTVYLDLNDNNALDVTEPKQVTAADGSYSFTGLDSGNYVVRQQTPANYQITSPQVAGRRLFTLNQISSTIYEIDGITGSILNSFAAPTAHNLPYGLAFDGQTLYFMAEGIHTLYKLNPNSGAVLDSMVIPGTNFDASIAVRQGKVYMLNRSGNGSITIFDPVTKTVTGSLPFQNGVYYGLQDSLGESPATNEFLIAAYHQIDFLDATTGIQTHSFELNYGFDVRGVEAIGNEIFVNHSNSIEVYSRTGTLLRTLNPPVTLGESAGYADLSGCYRISLPPGFPAINVNFGDQSVFGSIRGTRWQDANQNHVRDAGEVPLPGKTMYLDLNDNGLFDDGEPTAATQSDGSYAFNNLPAGNYVVRAKVTLGFSQTYPLNAKNRLFVAGYVSRKIYELDPNTGAILNSFNSPVQGYPNLAFDGIALYALSETEHILYKLNPDTGAILASATLLSGTYVGLAAENGKLYSYPIGNQFTVIDPVTMSVIGWLPTSSNADTLWTAGQMTNPDRIMGLNTNSQVVSFDTATGAESVGFTVAGTASVISASGSGSKLYASDDNGHINVYASPSGAFLQSLNFAPSIDALVYLAGTQGAQRITLAPGQTFTGADFGIAEPSLINQPPSMDIVLSPVTIVQNASAPTVNLTGISAGPFETQGITITATSSNPTLIPNPTVTYTNFQTTGTLTLTPAPNQIGTASITITMKDDGGNIGGGYDTFIMIFGVIVNDAPVLDASKSPTLPTVAEDPGGPSGAVGALVSSLVDFATPSGELDNVTDIDSGAQLGIAVTGVDSSLSCFYSLNGGSNWFPFSFGGPSDSTPQLLAADSDNRIYCQPNLNVNGTFANALTFRAWDRTTGSDGGIGFATTNGGGTAYSSATDGVSLTVTPVNDLPTATNLSTGETYSEDTAKNLVDILVGDVDNATLTVTLTISNVNVGSLNTATSGAVTSTYNAATGVWTASGPITNVNTLLAGLTFTPIPDSSANFTIATSVSDGIAAPITGSKAMTGTAVNDAPILDASKSLTLGTLNEDPGSPSGAVGILVSSLVDFANPAGQLDNVTDIDSGALLGIAITATDPQVTCYYSLNGGTTWSTVGTATASSSRLLAADADNRLYCQPGANLNGTFASAVTFRAWDRSSGTDGGTASTTTSGGTTPYSAVSTSISLTVTAVNDAPTATNSSAAESYTEDTALNLIDMLVTDVDSTLVTATLTLSNTGAGTLSTSTSNAVTSTFDAGTGVWSASGAIADVNALLAAVVFTPTLNFNNIFSITTSFSDGLAASSGSKTMTGIAVNDAPTATNLSAAESYTEDNSVNLNDIVVNDVDNPTVTVSLALSIPAAGTLSTGTSGSTTSTYNAAAGIWTVLGPIADVNTLLAAVTFNPAPNFNGNFSITTSVSDGVAAPVTGSKAVTGTAVNDAPTATNLNAAESYTEDTLLNLIDIVVSDVDSTTVTVLLTLSNPDAGALTTGTSGATTATYNAGTGVWTASGPIADVNVLLAGVKFNPTLNFNSNFTIATSVSDGVANAITGNKNMTGVAVDDAPTATNLNAAETYTEDTPLDLIDILVGDVDSATVTATLTLSNSAAGTLSTGTSGAVMSTFNTGTGVWTASGPTVDINSLLASVVFTPAHDFNATLTIATSISDGIAAAITGNKVVTGTPVDDSPTATNLNAAESYTEDVSVNLTDIVVSDVDSTIITATLTLSNSSAGSLSTATSGGVTSTYNSGAGVWTASGSIANVNALLAGVTFVPTSNFNGNFTIAISVSDDGAAAAATGSKAVTGTAVNDAPVLNTTKSPTLAAVLEDPAVPSGAVGTLVASLVDFATPSGGLDNVTDSDSGAQLGIAITGADSNLTCYYSLDGGANWATIGAVTNAAARLVAADGDNRVYCRPGLNLNGAFASALTFRAWDQTSGTDGGTANTNISGGTTAFSISTDVIGLLVTSVNDAPTATNLNAAETYTEDIELNLINIVVSDVDNSTTTAMLTLSNSAAGSLSTGTSGAVTSTFNAGTGVWTASGALADVNALLAGVVFTPTLNFHGDFSIATSVSDGVAAAVTGSKAVTGTPANDAPVLDATKSLALPALIEDFGSPNGAVGSLVSSFVDFAVPPGQLDNVSDVDSGALLGIAVTAVDPNLICHYSLNGGATWATIGSGDLPVAHLFAADTDNRIYCQPRSNVNGTFANAFTFRAWDQSDGVGDAGLAQTTNVGGTSPFSVATASVSLFVAAVNDAPARTSATTTLAAVDEDSLDPAGDSVSNLFGTVFSDVDGTTIATGGVAIVANAATAEEGTWQIQVGGSSFTDLPALTDSTSVIVLAAGDLIRFLPASNFNGVPGGLVTRLWDGTSLNAAPSIQDISSSIGDSGAFADDANEITLSTTITPVNDPPFFDPFSGSSTAADEDEQTHGPSPQKVEPGWVKNFNPGAPYEANQQLTFQLDSDNPDLFSVEPEIDSHGNLTYTPKPNAHGTANVSVTLRDDAGGDDTSASHSFQIIITKTHPLHNASNTGKRIGLDVTGSTSIQPDGFVVAGDVLAVINYINAKGSGGIPDNVAAGPPYVDVTANDDVSADDVIKIINYINANPGQTEGEDGVASAVQADSLPPDLVSLLSMDIAEQAVRRRRL